MDDVFNIRQVRLDFLLNLNYCFMYLLKKSSYLLFPVFALALVFSCTKENLSEDRVEESVLTAEELKVQIQNDGLTIALKNKGIEEFNVFLAQDGVSNLMNEVELGAHFSRTYRLEYFEAIKSKYSDLKAYSDKVQIEIVFDVPTDKIEIAETLQRIYLQKSASCGGLLNGIFNALDAAFVFSDIGNHEGVNDMTELANNLMEMYQEHCG